MIELRIESETDALTSVVVHSPGAEIEAMTPDTARDLLYNDIVPLAVVQTHHQLMKSVLEIFCDVRELTDLAAAAFRDQARRDSFQERFLLPGGSVGKDLDGVVDRELLRDLLAELTPDELVRTVVEGLPLRKDSLRAYLSGRAYAHPPLPNLYFMRDSTAVVRSGFIAGAMAYPVRTPEALLTAAALEAITGTETPLLYDGRDESDPTQRMEGGDILVLRKDLLVVGVSERTAAAAIDRLAAGLLRHYREPFTMIAVTLPQKRYAIHLDMLFTMIDHETALVHAPSMLGEAPLRAVRMHCDPGKAPVITSYPSLLRCLADTGLQVEPVICGGSDPVRREREQWLSGTNAFAVAPGKILVYDCNVATLEELDRGGYAVLSARQILDAPARARDPGKLAVTIPGAELARGGGGPRCMTLPLRR